ncbi:DgyrCDS8353 [Dimorphilus gyrociliatus]|nr:DgyrCDS8353 [Dimorphilus gyrociliatus]
MLYFVVIYLFAAILLYGGFAILKGSPPKIYGFYSQAGSFFRVKVMILKLLMYLRARKKSGKSSGYGKSSHETADLMEHPQALTSDKNSFDSVYASFGNSEGARIVCRVSHRQQNRAEICLLMEIPGKGYFETPVFPDTTLYNCSQSNKMFSAGGLRFICIEPMKKWIIHYDGLLRKGRRLSSDEPIGELVHCKLWITWKAGFSLYNYDTDICPNMVAQGIAREIWSREFFQELENGHQTHYEQWGESFVTFQQENQDIVSLNVRGMRDHSFGIRDWNNFHRYIMHLAYFENGTYISLALISLENSVTNWVLGHIGMPNGFEKHNITWSDKEIWEIGEQGKMPDEWTIHFKAGDKDYKLTVKVTGTTLYYYGENRIAKVTNKMCDFTLNDIKGYGNVEVMYRNDTESNLFNNEPEFQLLKELAINKERNITVPFQHNSCKSSNIVGGKGMQLALLDSLDDKRFKVPKGFCVTVTAFNEHFNGNSILKKQLEMLKNACSINDLENLRMTCEKTMELIVQSEISLEMKDEIENQLTDTFQGSQVRVAVRSSAVGEDGDEMSAAGQMDTFLGMKTDDEIIESVKKCWASYFSFVAVQYRRQNGQEIVQSMAVVVQEMVPAESAGVMFTRDAVTHSPCFMTISGNFGLGESVVSGSSDPDVIRVKRGYTDELSIDEIVIGEKKASIQMKEDSGGIEEIVNDTDNKEKLACLSEKDVLRLAEIGIFLEKRFGSPRDVEWAIFNGEIFLLQARPVTTGESIPDEHLKHEFDTATLSSSEIMTTANIGEMLPGAITPLTVSTFSHALDYTFCQWFKSIGVVDKIHINGRFMGVSNNHLFINLHAMEGLCVRVQIADKRFSELAIAGQTLDDLISEESLFNFWPKISTFKRIYHVFTYLMEFRRQEKRMKEWAKREKSFKVGNNLTSSKELWEEINKKKYELNEVWRMTLINSARGSSWSQIIMSILSQGIPDWKSEHYSDMAMLLSNCENVYSASVPEAIQHLASCISKDDKRRLKFISLSPQDAYNWFQRPENTDINNLFKDFIERHGHRCIREAEMMEKSWKIDNEKIISILQTMLQTPIKEKPSNKGLGINESIDQIKSTKLNIITRLILKIVLPKAKNGVGVREEGKSMAVKIHDEFKQAYWRLASIMVKEGFIPEEELLFFFTHDEIGEMIKNRSGRLLSLVKRRKRYFPNFQKSKFNKMNAGKPIPIDPEEDESLSYQSKEQLKG